MIKHSLLTEKLAPVRFSDGSSENFTLPGIFNILSQPDSEPFFFDSLQIHQQHAWHAFLVQLAAIALNKNSFKTVDGFDEEKWREMLLSLTDGDEAPWCLIVDDWTKPAFMQPPSPANDIFKKPDNTRDISDFDLLVLSKSHDIKMNRINKPELAHWIYSLVTYQTMSGFSGNKNYNIARMNSGFGSRPCVTFVYGSTPSLRFCRDVNIALKIRDNHRYWEHLGFNYKSSRDLGLLWLEPWDGKDQIELEDCDPYFIEICRRIRLQEENDKVVAFFKGTEKARINAANIKGRTGDLWTPIDTSKPEPCALTIPERGFGYEMMRRLIFEDQIISAPTAKLYDFDSGKFEIFAEVVSRGQGQTNGYHSKRIPIPKKIVRLFSKIDDKNLLAERAKYQVDDAKVANTALKLAIFIFLDGKQGKIDFNDKRADEPLRLFDLVVDHQFFDNLWSCADEDSTHARVQWQKFLTDRARKLLRQAYNSLPCSDAVKYKNMTHADVFFQNYINKNFPQLTVIRKGGEDHDSR